MINVVQHSLWMAIAVLSVDESFNPVNKMVFEGTFN